MGTPLTVPCFFLLYRLFYLFTNLFPVAITARLYRFDASDHTASPAQPAHRACPLHSSAAISISETVAFQLFNSLFQFLYTLRLLLNHVHKHERIPRYGRAAAWQVMVRVVSLFN
jgi:hypothetical protein